MKIQCVVDEFREDEGEDEAVLLFDIDGNDVKRYADASFLRKHGVVEEGQALVFVCNRRGFVRIDPLPMSPVLQREDILPDLDISKFRRVENPDANSNS